MAAALTILAELENPSLCEQGRFVDESWIGLTLASLDQE